jgi:hypothetical protein
MWRLGTNAKFGGEADVPACDQTDTIDPQRSSGGMKAVDMSAKCETQTPQRLL